jgi:hypothetical protein
MKESRSESITVRVPTDLMKAVRERAIALGMGETENDISVSEVVKAALKTFVGIDSDTMPNAVSDNVKHRLETLEVLVSAINLDALKSEILKDVELLIANIPSGKAVVNAIAAPEIRHNQLDLTDIPPASQAIAVSPEVKKSLITVNDKPKSTKGSAKSKPILTRPEAMAIAVSFGFTGTGQNLYDWAKAALTAKSDESRSANNEKLAVVGLIAVLSPENKPAWQAKA